MDRRSTLAALFGLNKTDNAAMTTTAGPPVTSGLGPYSGPFGFEQAAHLLRRATFGPTYKQIKEGATNGLDATMAALLADQPMPAPPVNYNYADDPNVPIGQTWVDAPYIQGEQGIQTYRNQSLRGWTIKTATESGVSLREKMTLFWHNHFVTSDINDPKFVYKYITLLRENALGNFRELTKLVTLDPSMLRYLNGSDNTAVAPNENYARELLELFTIGKGPIAGPSDYTNYTEDDVVQMARVLTGWRDRGYFSNDPALQPSALYVNGRHDHNSKQLSYRFDNIVINDMGNQEYAHLVDIIFSKDECARFISRKLYRWFVYYMIDEQVENDVIEPMAQLIVANDYDIKPALDALLRSEHFFDMLNFGPMIKSPIDFVIGLLRIYEVEFPNNINQQYRLYFQFQRTPLPLMQQAYYELPSVAGWKAYYQEPTFYRTWISSATLPIRMDYSTSMVMQGVTNGGATAQVDVLKFVNSIDNPADPNSVIDEFSKILFPQPIASSQKAALKEILIPGLPDFEWTVEYGEYVNNPNDPNAAAAVETKLRNLLVAMMSMPEYFLS